MDRCLVVPGPFLPYNDTITQLVYKQLRLLPLEYDVIALNNPKDAELERQLQEDPHYRQFHIRFTDEYNNVLFSIKNINLFKGLSHMKNYIRDAVQAYNGQKYLYTNSWPCYTIRVGVELKKLHPELKWIASFSDPINHSPYKDDPETYRSYSLPEKIAFKLYCKYYVVDEDEAHAFEQADMLVFICEEQRDFMIEQYMTYFHQVSEEEIRKKCVIVPLNYIPEWHSIVPSEPAAPNKVFTLSHFGRVYGLRLTKEFILAFAMFVKKHPETEIRIKQFGEFRKTDEKLIHQLNLDAYFEIHDKVPYAECIREMNSADAVLLFDTILPEDQFQPYLPSKILEYSQLKKHVLAITTGKAPSYRIVRESGAIACRYDRNDILTGLEQLVIERRPSLIDYAKTNQEAVTSLLHAIEQLG